MTVPNLSSDSTSPFECIEKLAKPLAAVSVVFYLTGIIVSNANLLSLGISDFELLRTRAIFIGFWFYFILSLGGWVYLNSASAAKEIHFDPANRLRSLAKKGTFVLAAFIATAPVPLGVVSLIGKFLCKEKALISPEIAAAMFLAFEDNSG
jgi:hypothetical protein